MMMNTSDAPEHLPFDRVPVFSCYNERASFEHDKCELIFREKPPTFFFTMSAQVLDENGKFYSVTSLVFISTPNGIHLPFSLIVLPILTGPTAVKKWYTQMYAFHD
jgi:hypothetical protein